MPTLLFSFAVAPVDHVFIVQLASLTCHIQYIHVTFACKQIKGNILIYQKCASYEWLGDSLESSLVFKLYC